MLSAAKHLLYLIENKQSRSFAEFTLSPFAPLRAVHRRKANGLRMTWSEGFFRRLPESGLAAEAPRKRR